MENAQRELVLYSYWRSSAAYRVRIALNIKQLPYQIRPVHLVREGGQQHQADYRRLNPQQLVPTLVHGELVLRQSLAIMEYLNETWPEGPLLPATAAARARSRAMAHIAACDIHPIGNLRVLQYLERDCGLDSDARGQWSRHWIEEGFTAWEAWLLEGQAEGPYCCGAAPSLADICLVPQAYNARRFGVDMNAWPRLAAVDAACREIDAFQRAAPEMQPDAP